jgi:DME family drug/metabolite transporter
MPVMSHAPNSPRAPTAPSALPGIACVLAAASLWGTTGTAQALAGTTLPAPWFGALRLVFAAGFFIAFAALSGALDRGTWGRLPRVAALGAGLCMAVYNLAFFAGVKLSGVAVGTAIALGSGPIWAGLLQALIQRQPPSGAWWVGTLAAVAGGAAMSVGAGGGTVKALSLPGLALCLLSGLSYAAYTLLNRRMVNRVPAAVITLAAFGIAAPVALAVAGLQVGLPLFSARDLIASAYTGIVSAGVAYLLFSHALRSVSAATGVTLALAEPVVAFVLALTLLGESAGPASVIGLALVVAGVLAVVRAELRSGGRPG